MNELQPILDHLLRPGSFAIMLAVYLLTIFTKKVVQTWKPSLKAVATEMADAPMYSNKAAMWWNEVILSAMPVVYGVMFGFKYNEFLHGTVTNTGGRYAFCACLGWFSGFGYKIVRKVILAKTGVDIGSSVSGVPASDRPAPSEPPASAA